MRKALIICCVLLFTTAMYGQDKTITYVFDKVSNSIERVYSDGTKVVDKAYTAGQTIAPKLDSAIKSLGSQLKVGADKVWDVLVRQQLVWSISILLCLCVTVFSWFHFWYRYIQWKKDTEDKHVVGCVICIAMAISGTIVVAMNFQTMMTGFINPEFGAMQTIATIASQIK